VTSGAIERTDDSATHFTVSVDLVLVLAAEHRGH
jgi:hypothetical protein